MRADRNAGEIALAINELESERVFLVDQIGRQKDPLIGACCWCLLFNLEKLIKALFHEKAAPVKGRA